MNITIYNHQFALLGSIATIITLLYMEKNRLDAENKTINLKKFFSKQWDDFVFLIMIAQILVLVQEYIVGAYVDYKQSETGWENYYNNEELISFCVGLFGNVLFIKIFKLGRKKINNHEL